MTNFNDLRLALLGGEQGLHEAGMRRALLTALARAGEVRSLTHGLGGLNGVRGIDAVLQG